MTHSTILTVPEDVMVGIFRLCVFLPHVRWWMADHWSAIYSLMVVCRQWRCYILNHAVFWCTTGIYPRDYEIFAEDLVARRMQQLYSHYRSDLTPLSVSIVTRPYLETIPPSLLSAIPRAKSLYIKPGSFDNFDGEWDPVFDPHPLLQRLVLWLPYHVDGDWKLVDKVLLAPQLRHLHVSLCASMLSNHIPALRDLLPRLETLTLLLTGERPLGPMYGAYIWDNLHAVLSAGRSLQALAAGVPYTYSRGPSASSIPMPNLEYLHWSGPIPNPMFHVLNLVRLDLQDSLFHTRHQQSILPFNGELASVRYISVWEQPVHGYPQFWGTLRDRVSTWDLFNHLPNVEVIELRMGHRDIHWSLLSALSDELGEEEPLLLRNLQLLWLQRVDIQPLNPAKRRAQVADSPFYSTAKLSSSRQWAENLLSGMSANWSEPPALITQCHEGDIDEMVRRHPLLRVIDARGSCFGANPIDVDSVVRLQQSFLSAGQRLSEYRPLYQVPFGQ